jgi:hypothetical protein
LNIDFSHRAYCELLEYIKGLGDRIVPFRDIPPSGRYVILRHDIDFSVAKAEEMAALDRQAGVQSTFFVLLTTPYYNPLDEENLQILRRIIGMGHEIGLHYDCSGFDALTFDEQYRRIQSLAACLEHHLNIQVKVIAQHKPAAATMHPEYPGYMDPYCHPSFRDIAYISDSRMLFRVKDVYAFFREKPRCQAVLHPIWWHKQPKTRAQIFEEIKTQLAQQFSRMIDEDHRIILDSLPQISLPSTERRKGGPA